MSREIDAHWHAFDPDRFRYVWGPIPAAASAAVGPDRIAIEGGVVVEDACDETAWLLSLGQSSGVLAVVGASVSDAPTAGKRYTVQSLKDWEPVRARLTQDQVGVTELLLNSTMMDGWSTVEQCGSSVVVDHLIAPPDRWSDPETAGWKSLVDCLGTRTLVNVKVSGRGIADSIGRREIRPFVDYVIDVISPDRLILGSNWPLCNEATYYDAWARAVESLIRAGLSDEQIHAVSGGNAARVYGIGDPA